MRIYQTETEKAIDKLLGKKIETTLVDKVVTADNMLILIAIAFGYLSAIGIMYPNTSYAILVFLFFSIFSTFTYYIGCFLYAYYNYCIRPQKSLKNKMGK